MCFRFDQYHRWANAHNIYHEYYIHFWFPSLLSLQEKTTSEALTVSDVAEIFYMQVLFLCISYYVNFLKRSRQQILNGLVDAVHMKTCMYWNCLILPNKSLSVPEIGILHWKVSMKEFALWYLSYENEGVCLMILLAEIPEVWCHTPK